MALPPWAADLLQRAQPFLDRLAVWRGYEQELQTLLLYGIGIALYTALVFAFYQSISRRDAFHTRRRPGWFGRVIHFTESALVFPVMSFLYFAMLTLSLFLLAKAQTTATILLISMAVVVGVRVTSFLSENMSVDLAKLVPMGLLGVMLVDPGYLSLQVTWGRIGEAASMGPLLGRYFLLFIALEASIQTLRGIGRRFGAWMERRRKQGKFAPKAPKLPKSVQMAHVRTLDVKGPRDDAPASVAEPRKEP